MDQTPLEQRPDQSREGLGERRGIRRLLSATGYSLSGLLTAWRSEAAFRQETLAALVLLPMAFWLGTSMVERVLLAGTVLFVLVVELLNTAVEYTVDRIGTDHHSLSGRAKDIGSAAVMVSLLLWAITWGGIAWGRFFGA